MTARAHWLRPHGRPARVGMAELFFDLVFVFAITQLSHTLLHHPTVLGALEAGLLLTGVWWIWVYTAWVTNWLDPERTPVRLLLFGMMGAGLVLSMSVPQAFAGRGLAFAASYAALQLGRTGFMLFALRGVRPSNFRNFLRIGIWLAVSAVFWLAGGLSEGAARLGLWATALAIEFCGPAAFFWVPGLGRSTLADWEVDGGHMAERCGLFIIIALGESILITGATMAELAWDISTLAAFAAALIGSIAMWWIYFDVGARRAEHLIAHAAAPGALARLAYTYLHLPIVAGIIVTAAGDELTLSHPAGHMAATTAWLGVGGPALYLAGVAAFKRVTVGWWPPSHMAGLAALAAIGAASMLLTPLLVGALTTAALVMVAVWESRSLSSFRNSDREGAHTAES